MAASTNVANTTADRPCLYDDDGGGSLQAQITKSMDENVEYLVIATFYNPSTTSGNITIWTQ